MGHPQQGVSSRHPYLIMVGYTMYVPVLGYCSLLPVYEARLPFFWAMLLIKAGDVDTNSGSSKWGGGAMRGGRSTPQYEKWEGERMFSPPPPPIIALNIYEIIVV